MPLGWLIEIHLGFHDDTPPDAPSGGCGWFRPRVYSHVTITQSFAVWSPLCGPVVIVPSLVVHADGIGPPFPLLPTVSCISQQGGLTSSAFCLFVCFNVAVVFIA